LKFDWKAKIIGIVKALFRIQWLSWLLKLNINKCNVVSFGRNAANAHQYSADNIDLEDLGITLDVTLNFSLHNSDKVNVASKMN